MIQQRLSHSKRSLCTPPSSLATTYRNIRTPLHAPIYPLLGLVTSLWLHWPTASCCSPPQIWYSPFSRPSKQWCLSTRMLNSSLLIPLAIPPPFFSQEASDKDALSLHHRSFGTHHRSPLLFPRNFLLYTLDLFIHTPTYWRWICWWHSSHCPY